MDHGSVLTSLFRPIIFIGFFRFYFILLTLSSRSRRNLISNCVQVHILATVSILIPHLFRQKFTATGSVLFDSTKRKLNCCGLNSDRYLLSVRDV